MSNFWKNLTMSPEEREREKKIQKIREFARRFGIGAAAGVGTLGAAVAVPRYTIPAVKGLNSLLKATPTPAKLAALAAATGGVLYSGKSRLGADYQDWSR